MRLVAVIVVLAACGRIGFDGLTTQSSDGGNDATDAPGVQQIATLRASNADANDHFGTGLAVSRDGSTIAIGAPGEDSASSNPDDNSATDAGAVYVFTLEGSTWTQQAYIKPAAPVANGNFGTSVALSADGSTLAVGETTTTTSTGSVHVFTRTGTTWGGEQIVVATVRDTGDSLGFAVALSSTADTLIAGAPAEDSGLPTSPNDNSASGAGAAYVFVRNGASWTQQAYIKVDTPVAGDQFGAAVACSGDGNEALIGAPGATSAAGGAATFTRSGTTWSEGTILTGSGIGGDYYGFAVALAADGTHGVVGAPGEDSIEANSGAGYALTGAGQMILKAPNAGNDDQLGAGVAIADDGTPFVGAPNEDSASQSTPSDDSAMDSGAVYELGSTPRYFKAAMPAAGDYLGQPIAVSGDGRTLAAGATGADHGGLVDSGMVVVSYFGQ